MKLCKQIRTLLADDSQAAHDLFGQTLGRDRADRLSRVWSNTYDNRSELDKLYKRGRSKREVFYVNALGAGFTADEIDAFLELQ